MSASLLARRTAGGSIRYGPIRFALNYVENEAAGQIDALAYTAYIPIHYLALSMLLYHAYLAVCSINLSVSVWRNLDTRTPLFTKFAG